MPQVVPKYEDIMWPTLKALEEIGGSASIHELNSHVAKLMQLSDEVLEIPHTSGSRSSFEYRSAWARTHLKFFGSVENSARGIWSITKIGREISSEQEMINLNKDARAAQVLQRSNQQNLAASDVNLDDGNEAEDTNTWEDKLLVLMKSMDPSAFERLCQRVLREAGFSKVEVTGKSGDGGIDGVGVLKVNLLSFHVRFQCKRYAESVSSGDVRNFRGAMQGRAEKGLFITTGRYTKDAEAEAIRDGAPPIDLIDGMELCGLLKEYALGVRTQLVEDVNILPDFFEKL